MRLVADEKRRVAVIATARKIVQLTKCGPTVGNANILSSVHLRFLLKQSCGFTLDSLDLGGLETVDDMVYFFSSHHKSQGDCRGFGTPGIGDRG